MTTYDRTFDTQGTSSVIEAVYYNTESQELFVELTRSDYFGDPVIAGYANVPENVYTAFELENTNRLAGKHASVGAYWNIWIKPHFTGVDTNGIELVPAEDEDDEAIISFAAEVSDASDAAAPDVEDDGIVTFVIFYREAGVVSEIFIDAEDGDAAMDSFDQIVELTGRNVSPVAILQFFESV